MFMVGGGSSLHERKSERERCVQSTHHQSLSGSDMFRAPNYFLSSSNISPACPCYLEAREIEDSDGADLKPSRDSHLSLASDELYRDISGVLVGNSDPHTTMPALLS
jgi:hypothetical protein